MNPFPRDEIHDEDAALDWWEQKFAAGCEEMGVLVNGAALVRSLVNSLREIRATGEARALTLAEAAEESGYSIDHLARLVRQNKIQNVGKPGSPRVRAADLPRKPAAQVAASPGESYNPNSDARFIRQSAVRSNSNGS
ncbi:MAG: hypothetical protein ACRENK_16975 [Gemmatimonadaceae bacterium]